MSTSYYDYVYTVLLVGDYHVGKSSLMSRFCENKFTTSHESTIGMDLKIQKHSFNGKHGRFDIWDSAGQERFRTMTTSYFRGVSAVLICFDLTNEDSFTNITYWIKLAREYAGDDVFVVLVGTKSDMKEEREISEEKIESLANEYGIQYFETSSKENNFVGETFCEVFDRLISESSLKKPPKNTSPVNVTTDEENNFLCPWWVK